MSVIYLTEHDENVYDIIKLPKERYIQPPRYISSFNKKVKVEMAKKTNKEKYSTMGPPEILPGDPKKYLRKRSGKSGQTLEAAPKPPNIDNIQAKVPKPGKSPKRTKQDFIRKNIIDIKKVTFKEPEPRYIDTRYGTSFPLEPSGLKPKYMIEKNAYGKPPVYLVTLMRTKEFHQKLDHDIAEIECLPKCRYITRQERDDLLKGLKQNWEEMQKEFQLLPMITDTIPKINRKLKLEKDLEALEKDIILIEKHPYIYIDETSNTDE